MGNWVCHVTYIFAYRLLSFVNFKEEIPSCRPGVAQEDRAFHVPRSHPPCFFFIRPLEKQIPRLEFVKTSI